MKGSIMEQNNKLIEELEHLSYEIYIYAIREFDKYKIGETNIEKYDIQISKIEKNILLILETIGKDVPPKNSTSAISDIKRHLSFFQRYRKEHNELWMKSNLDDIVERDIPSLKSYFKNMKSNEQIWILKDKYFDIFDIEIKKQEFLQLAASVPSNKYFSVVEGHLITAEERIEDPRSTLQYLSEAIENMCKGVWYMFEYENNGQSGLGLHNQVIDLMQKKRKDFRPEFQTGLRHIIQRCNIKKHKNYEPSDIEMFYLILLAWEGIIEIFEYLPKIDEN
ncbi:MAG TPA: hypothetical protein PK718_03160 [Candidatus Methanofastidiosa archaeon]|nr:hypothetical protein [Candidatus Methanofastidiosa archaeon]